MSKYPLKYRGWEVAMYTYGDGLLDARWGWIDVQMWHSILIPKEVLTDLLPVGRLLYHTIGALELG